MPNHIVFPGGLCEQPDFSPRWLKQFPVYEKFSVSEEAVFPDIFNNDSNGAAIKVNYTNDVGTSSSHIIGYIQHKLLEASIFHSIINTKDLSSMIIINADQYLLLHFLFFKHRTMSATYSYRAQHHRSTRLTLIKQLVIMPAPRRRDNLCVI